MDANVLFSRTLRDWTLLLRNASGGLMFTVGASEDILAETVARLRDAHPTFSGGNIARLRRHLESQLDEIIDEFEIADWMLVEDEGDAHVRAAAVAGQFDMLLTSDRGLLADAEREKHASYEPIHPDDFFVLVFDSAPEVVDEVMGLQLRYFMNRDGEADLPRWMENSGCPNMAERLREHLRSQM